MAKKGDAWCTFVYLFFIIGGIIGFSLWIALGNKSDHQKVSMPPQATAGFQISLLSLDTKVNWCTSQISTCGLICAYDDTTESNDCNPLRGTWTCECDNSTYPDVSAFTGSWPYLQCQETYQQCLNNVTKANPSISLNDTTNAAFSTCNANHLCGSRNATDELRNSIAWDAIQSTKPHPKFTTGAIVGISFGAVIAAILNFTCVYICCMPMCKSCVHKVKQGRERRRTMKAAARRAEEIRKREIRQAQQGSLLATPAATLNQRGQLERRPSNTSLAPSYTSYALDEESTTWTHTGTRDTEVRADT